MALSATAVCRLLLARTSSYNSTEGGEARSDKGLNKCNRASEVTFSSHPIPHFCDGSCSFDNFTSCQRISIRIRHYRLKDKATYDCRLLFIMAETVLHRRNIQTSKRNDSNPYSMSCLYFDTSPWRCSEYLST